MSGAHSKAGFDAWTLVPPPLRRKLQSEPGRRFLRFVPVSLAALASSQITLALLIGVAHISAGVAAFVASIVGAGVSYVLSRWAWERKGRPDLLRETLPFWVVSVAAWIFLSFVSHEASAWSKSMHHGSLEHVAVVNGAYFLANCFTFAARFVIFHYVLFRSHGDKAKAAQVLSPGQQFAEAESDEARRHDARRHDGLRQEARQAEPELAPAPLEMAADWPGQPRPRG
jgi:putative flippase GtrA